MGVLPIGPNQRSLPVEDGARIIRYALERGINFIDTAQYYQTSPYIKEALKGTNFEPIISSKCLGDDYKTMEMAIEEARRDMDRDVIDIFLLHEVRPGRFAEKQGAWECLHDAKAKGLVKSIGISTHHVDVCNEMASVPDCEVVFPLINYAGLGIRKGSGTGTAEEMLESIKACYDAGKGIYAMKAFGGGVLTGNYQKALKFILEKPEIHSLNSYLPLFDYLNLHLKPYLNH